MSDTTELLDRMRADDERRAKLEGAVRLRIAQIEQALPWMLLERQRLIHEIEPTLENTYYAEMARERDAIVAEIERLVREHAALEAIEDRRDARRWRWIQLCTSGAIGSLITLVLSKLFG